MNPEGIPLTRLLEARETFIPQCFVPAIEPVFILE